MKNFDFIINKRSHLYNKETNAFRLIDAAGDQLPNIYLETFADQWLVSTTSSEISPLFTSWLKSQNKTIYHKRIDQHQKESPKHFYGSEIHEPFLIRENNVNLEISFQSGYSQGIFLDQRNNRKLVMDRIQAGQTLLNTFAYTGAFSVCAAKNKAQTTTLDLSQPYLDWAKRNFTHNSLDPNDHYFCKGDTFHWLKRFKKQGRKFNGIILDPPTFSRDEKGTVFRVENDFGKLAELAFACLLPNGWMLCSTNCHKLNQRDFEQQLRIATNKKVNLSSTRMPEDFTAISYLKSIWIDA
jgi:23S rRNA (cytosine1962-C5)-methyltransferase